MDQFYKRNRMEDKIMSILMSVESRMEKFFLFHILRPIPRKSRCARKCENCVNCVKASRGFFFANSAYSVDIL